MTKQPTLILRTDAHGVQGRRLEVTTEEEQTP